MKASVWSLILGLAAFLALGTNAFFLERERPPILAENARLQSESEGVSDLEARREDLQQQLETLAAQDLDEKAASVRHLKESLGETRLRYQRAMMSDFPRDAAPPRPKSVPWKPVVRWTRGQWQSRGRGSAMSAFETLVACTEAGDADGVESVISLSPGAEPAAAGMLSTRTPATRAVWSTPRSFVATLLTMAGAGDCQAVSVLSADGANPAMLLICWSDSAGRAKDLVFKVEHGADGYRVVVPLAAVLQAYSIYYGHP